MITSKMGTGGRIVLMVFMVVVMGVGFGLALKLASNGFVWIAALPVAFVIGTMGALFPPGDASDLE
jgi:hypothetical protein